jgi:hypothetical protein
LKDCSAHRKCGLLVNESKFLGWSDLTTRVLELDSSNDSLRLVEGKSCVDPYVTLSYCWGTLQTLTTTKSSIVSREQEIGFSELPLTLQDAVRVTRELDIHYLWIDALYIIQDDNDDWQREAARMASVYRNSHLTIAASNAAKSSAGFFRTRKSAQQCELSYRLPDGGSSIVYLQHVRGHSRDTEPLKNEP